MQQQEIPVDQAVQNIAIALSNHTNGSGQQHAIWNASLNALVKVLREKTAEAAAPATPKAVQATPKKK